MIKNIAIIAHVDHGKTTLVDAMFRQSGLFRPGSELKDRVMDNMDLERERGITISAKNCSVRWKETKINIIDTPGHADFGGEVERALSMADGAILLVDSSEGPLPQTRFVLKKTLEKGLKVIVVVNKIDRKDARPAEVLNEIYDLFIDLGADDSQLEFPVLYAIGREGIAQTTLEEKGTNLHPLFEAIVKEIPQTPCDPKKPFQMLVSDLGYSEFMGKLAIGKVFHGSAQANDPMVKVENDSIKPFKVTLLQVYEGIKLEKTERAHPGDIVILAGVEDVKIGDTICHRDNPIPLPRIDVDEPTISMEFTTNTSPFSGREGKYVQAGKIRERLLKETLRNVSIKVEELAEKDRFLVKGRGEFQMAILVETMRREGFELSVGRPTVIYRHINGKIHEPIENLYIDCGEEYFGLVTQKLSERKGRMTNLQNSGDGRVRAEFNVPSRSLIGYRDLFLTDTRGTGILCPLLAGFEEYRGDFPTRSTGSIVCDRPGFSATYSLFNLEDRGRLFIRAAEPVYEGMIIGEYNREGDLDVNAIKPKKMTNIRAANKDDNVVLSPIQDMTLEKAINFIGDDELVEITPTSIRLRKRILSATERHTKKGQAKKVQN